MTWRIEEFSILIPSLVRQLFLRAVFTEASAYILTDDNDIKSPAKRSAYIYRGEGVLFARIRSDSKF